MKKIIVLFIDAFSHNYLNREDTPFLSTQNVHTLRPVFGFKQLASVFTGLDPCSSGWLAEHYYDPENSPFKWTQSLPSSLLTSIDFFLRKPIDFLNYKILHQNKVLSSKTPLKLAKFFDINEKPFPEKSLIMSLLKEKGLSHRFIFHPEVKTNEEAFKLFKLLYNTKKLPDFLFLHFPELDPVTHSLGTESISRVELTRRLDHMIEKIFMMTSKNSYIIAFSDHGMIDVKNQINLYPKINKLGHLGRDFLVFFDSIMVRFWIFNNSLTQKIEKMLDDEIHGKIVYSKSSEMNEMFGDLMFLCKPGYILFPNFYDQKPPKSMHGYHITPSSKSPLSGILFVSDLLGISKENNFSMTDIASILKHTIESL